MQLVQLASSANALLAIGLIAFGCMYLRHLLRRASGKGQSHV
ncbi:MAG: hypothetical protein SOZ90_03680 [Candidatus Faecousia sp.]|nr:hypothetical protein [Candidatus Faecousia sp.]